MSVLTNRILKLRYLNMALLSDPRNIRLLGESIANGEKAPSVSEPQANFFPVSAEVSGSV